ncbi:Cytochrome b-c1 complex subunit 8 [Penicillium atrosanguineum]|nr:Cytochrome b-c1 complex subunit 8 [Penicillium atrosanguineum]
MGGSVDPKNGHFIGTWGEFDTDRPRITSTWWNGALTTSGILATGLDTNPIDLQAARPPQRIATYAVSSNRQRPFAGAFHAAIFNVFRRFRNQVLYVAPPFIIAYAAMNWAVERNEYLNSKPGRMLEGGSGEE